MEKHTESEKDTQLLCSVSAKKTRRGEEWADLGCSNIFYDIEGKLLASLPSKINLWWHLIKRQNNKDGFNVSPNTVLRHHHFIEKKKIRKSFLRCKVPPGSVPSQNLPGKTTTPK